MPDITDRRNELSGNLSLYQELGFIEKIDQMLEEEQLPRDGKYKQIVVRVIELSRSRFSRSLGTASKLNRDPRFIEDLMFHGEARAEEFLAALAFEDAWRSRDAEELRRKELREVKVLAENRERELRQTQAAKLGEASEAYEVEVLDGPEGAVLRTLGGLSTPAAVYGATEQAADFGSVQTTVHLRVFQLSATIGRGFPVLASL
jgi:hypothetical protein